MAAATLKIGEDAEEADAAGIGMKATFHFNDALAFRSAPNIPKHGAQNPTLPSNPLSKAAQIHRLYLCRFPVGEATLILVPAALIAGSCLVRRIVGISRPTTPAEVVKLLNEGPACADILAADRAFSR